MVEETWGGPVKNIYPIKKYIRFIIPFMKIIRLVINPSDPLASQQRKSCLQSYKSHSVPRKVFWTYSNLAQFYFV